MHRGTHISTPIHTFTPCWAGPTQGVGLAYKPSSPDRGHVLPSGDYRGRGPGRVATPARQRVARRSNGPPARLRTAITASRGAGSMEMLVPFGFLDYGS